MKFYDVIKFSSTVETSPGIWGPAEIVERYYPGDLTRMITKWTRNGDKVNEDKRVNNQLKIIADEFLKMNFTNIRSVMWMGQEWAVNTVTYEPPHIILEIGELYNGT